MENVPLLMCPPCFKNRQLTTVLNFLLFLLLPKTLRLPCQALDTRFSPLGLQEVKVERLARFSFFLGSSPTFDSSGSSSRLSPATRKAVKKWVRSKSEAKFADPQEKVVWMSILFTFSGVPS
jgi:hypothetical protein